MAFDLDQEFKKLKDSGKPGSLPKMAQITAGSLDRAASQNAFQIYRHPIFRRLVSFESLEKIEQDRIFNELVVTNIVLLMLSLEANDLRIKEELKEFILLVKDSLPKAHCDELANLGIEKQYLDIWEKLIKLRYEEYSNNKNEIREASMQLKARDKELTTDDIVDIQSILPLQTVAFGCFDHICRGKTKGKEDLLNFLIRHQGRFYIQMRILLEGVKLPLWKKMKMKAKWFLKDLKDK